MRQYLTGVALPLLIFIWVRPAMGQVTFYNDRNAWLVAVQNAGLPAPIPFPTDSAHIGLANEVDPPGPDAQMGSTLTYLHTNLGFCLDFQLRALQSGANLVYNDNEATDAPTESISIGDVDNHENDDWDIRFQNGFKVRALAFELYGNLPESGETINVYASADNFNLFESTSNNLGASFIGIISTVPIERVSFNEHSGGDDIAIGAFEFVLFDTDGDAHPDICDNCAATHNMDQADADADGIGDLCEIETSVSEAAYALGSNIQGALGINQ